MVEIKRGDVIDIDFEPARGHEIRKTRPAVVVQNDVGNRYSPLVIVSPIRGAEHLKRPYPAAVIVEKGAGGLDKKSVVQCDQIKSLDKSRIVRKRGGFSVDIMKSIDAALKISLALI
ncbi:MAG: type II toxin-antitoxin system PemK/MazF family toxin [Deltaproteobacteria bacterium]|nr:type II toxin-antitoxin system PemK/MazF family toxin [Deltaproteobacteria bacterium]HDZ89813.1 type II toxin-antitoxin system PemK/MazF family toxin [Deltaproteobacteria bacterium]